MSNLIIYQFKTTKIIFYLFNFKEQNRTFRILNKILIKMLILCKIKINKIWDKILMMYLTKILLVKILSFKNKIYNKFLKCEWTSLTIFIKIWINHIWDKILMIFLTKILLVRIPFFNNTIYIKFLKCIWNILTNNFNLSIVKYILIIYKRINY